MYSAWVIQRGCVACARPSTPDGRALWRIVSAGFYRRPDAGAAFRQAVSRAAPLSGTSAQPAGIECHGNLTIGLGAGKSSYQFDHSRRSPMQIGGATWLTGRPSTRWRRTISYLTCTRSRGSKKSCPPAKAWSPTLCGRGWRAPAARRAAALGSSGGRRLAICLNTLTDQNNKSLMTELVTALDTIGINSFKRQRVGTQPRALWTYSRLHSGRNLIDSAWLIAPLS